MKNLSVSLMVFFAVVVIYSPLIVCGGFHHQDDYHFFRQYSSEELRQAWYSNYNFVGIESDGYRPLFIWTNHLLYSLLGFKDWPFMLVIIILNGGYAAIVYLFARNFLDNPYSIAAGLLSVLLPQALMKFTWPTEIYTTILAILMVLGYHQLFRWQLKREKKYLWAALLLGVISSLYKEMGYCLLLSIPIMVIVNDWHFQGNHFKRVVRQTAVWLSPVILVTFAIFRQIALAIYPERLNRDLILFKGGRADIPSSNRSP